MSFTTKVRLTSTGKKGESWTEEGMRSAIKAVQLGRLSDRAASVMYNIPRRTLRDRLKLGFIEKRLGRKPIFTKKQESDFAEKMKRFGNNGVPLTTKFIRQQAYLFCERYNIKNNFKKTERLAGLDWVKGFLKRNPSVKKKIAAKNTEAE